MMHQFKSGVLILGIAALSSGSAALTTGNAFAADVKSIAILTPEEGTDYGWNQQGIDAAKAAGAKENVKVLVGQNLGYGDVRPTMRELAEDGANLLIAHASGYNTAAPEIGAEMNVAVAVVDKPGTGVPGKIADYTLSGHQGRLPGGPPRRQDEQDRHRRHRGVGRAALVEFRNPPLLPKAPRPRTRRSSCVTPSSARPPTATRPAASG